MSEEVMKMIAIEVVRERLLDHIHQVSVQLNLKDRIWQKYIMRSDDQFMILMMDYNHCNAGNSIWNWTSSSRLEGITRWLPKSWAAFHNDQIKPAQDSCGKEWFQNWVSPILSLFLYIYIDWCTKLISKFIPINLSGNNFFLQLPEFLWSKLQT